MGDITLLTQGEVDLIVDKAGPFYDRSHVGELVAMGWTQFDGTIDPTVASFLPKLTISRDRFWRIAFC